jgi:hypothetical protein
VTPSEGFIAPDLSPVGGKTTAVPANQLDPAK